MKDTLLGDVVANDTEMIHEAYLAGEESEESKNARHVLRAMIVIFLQLFWYLVICSHDADSCPSDRKAKRCRCILTVLLILSLVQNAMLAPAAILYISGFFTTGKFFQFAHERHIYCFRNRKPACRQQCWFWCSNPRSCPNTQRVVSIQQRHDGWEGMLDI